LYGTHLIAVALIGRKYEHAKCCGIIVIAPGWLDDRIKPGWHWMALEKQFYDPKFLPEGTDWPRSEAINTETSRR
jgi:hypothetical protein